MVGLGGFEPPTSRLSGVRSNQLSYRPAFLKENGLECGKPTGDRNFPEWRRATRPGPVEDRLGPGVPAQEDNSAREKSLIDLGNQDELPAIGGSFFRSSLERR